MTEPIKIGGNLAEAIADVIDELASELDLHCEDDELPAAGEAIERMETLVTMLEASGFAAPGVYEHIIGRYHRCLN